MMDWEKFKDMFHSSWHKWMKPWIESKECYNIYKFLKTESGRGKLISPLSKDVWRAFKETSYDNLNIVFMGLSPYHTFVRGKPICNGLLMDCSITGRLQPSLDKFYESIERELYSGLNLNIYKSPDLSYLAHQGILLINASLTCERNKAGSHTKLWEPFTIYLITEVLNNVRCPIVFLGKEASKYSKYVAPITWTFELTHPAAAARNGVEWETEKVFTSLSKILKDSKNIEIKWMKNI